MNVYFMAKHQTQTTISGRMEPQKLMNQGHFVHPPILKDNDFFKENGI